MKNKIAIYIGILLVGIVLGWLFFGDSSQPEIKHDHDLTMETNQLWTCSMHPQIIKPEPGNCPICGMDLIPTENNADGLLANQFKLTKNAMALANVQTSIVGTSSIGDDGIKLSGKIVENEEANAVQVSYFSGRIERLYVNFTGEKVRKGQLLATVYSPELYAAQQELITAALLKESQPALYKAVRNKLKLWKLSDNQINQIEATGKVKENFPVYATVSGTVSEKLVEQGDYIKQGQPLLKIANLNTVWALFDVYENQIDVFKKGQEVLITTNANGSKVFYGKIDFIDPILDTRTRTVKLRVVLDNTNNKFKPGMFVEGQVKGINLGKAQLLTIPSTSVLWTGERSVVYLKTNPDQPIFEMREILLGNQIGNNYEILEGLDNGDEIVTNGTFTVDAAAQLQGKKSMMNQKEEQQAVNSTETIPAMKLELSKRFQKEFKTLLETYFEMKNAFVTSDAITVARGAEAIYQNIKKIDTGDLGKLELVHFNSIKDNLENISEEKNIEAQRAHFVILNENMVVLVSNSTDLDHVLYVQKCPMANNNNGALWLSTEKEIKNPYYGDAMLNCGEVKQVIE